MITKTLLSIFIAFSITFGFTGCTKYVDRPVFIEASCPYIPIKTVVPKMEGPKDNCLCNKQLQSLLERATDLRRSESYYVDVVGAYNEKYAKPKSDLDN